MSPLELSELVATALGIPGIIIGWWHKGLPAWRRRRDTERAKTEALLGRGEIPADPVTGEPARPAIPALGDRLAGFAARLDKAEARDEYIIGLVHDVQHEVKTNSGGSMRDEVRWIKDRLSDGDGDFVEIKDRLDSIESSMVTNAEAQRAVWPAIEAVAKSSPPDDI